MRRLPVAGMHVLRAQPHRASESEVRLKDLARRTNRTFLRVDQAGFTSGRHECIIEIDVEWCELAAAGTRMVGARPVFRDHSGEGGVSLRRGAERSIIRV